MAEMAAASPWDSLSWQAALARSRLYARRARAAAGVVDQGAEVGNRLGGSVAAAMFAAQHGAQILRVHDVAETRQALTVQTALLDF